MQTYYATLCKAALTNAGPRNATFNTRYREELADLGLRLGDKPPQPLPGYPDGVPKRAPKAVDEGDDGWYDQYILWDRRSH